MKNEKKYDIEKQDVSIGYGQMILPGERPIDDVDVLLNGLATWGEMTAEADAAIKSCLLYVAHREPRVRAVSIAQLARLVPYSNRERAPAISAVSVAIADTDPLVREAARTAVESIRASTGIEIDRKSSA